jgi:adenosine/AMP kinase
MRRGDERSGAEIDESHGVWGGLEEVSRWELPPNLRLSHFFIILDNAYPINVRNALKSHPAVVTIFVASANPLDVLVAETELGRAVIGVIDGTSANRIETEGEKKERRELCEKLGYAVE